MSSDAVAVLALAPDEAMTVAALVHAVPQLEVGRAADGTLHLAASDGIPWFTVEVPVLVQVEGEADRLLGEGPPVPCPGWWVECRADPRVPGAADAARAVARALARLGRGTLWSTAR